MIIYLFVNNSVYSENRTEFADSLYKEGRYLPAELEYLRLKHSSSGLPDPLIDSRLALTYYRMGDFRKGLDAVQYLPGQMDFSVSYLRMYGSLRAGLIFNAVYEFDRIRNLPPDKLTDSQLDYANLLSGLFLLERGEYQKSLDYYRIFRDTAYDEKARSTAEKIAQEIENYSALPRKKPWLAGVYSAALPGGGHFYSGQTMAGLTALAVNLFFWGGAAYMYNLERETGKPHYGSGLFAAGGIVFYSASVSGGVAAARRYNQYQERAFQQNIRDIYFNTDFIEDTSGVFPADD